ncbi:MAG: DUF4942 domain-containing protein, partial [Bacteroidaceae bacterium]|nr:DUF4942 domain-containing protein [Bacteroidaceae bacterium]
MSTNYQNMFNRDFYPTPEKVIEEMLKVSEVTNKIILEPSAGTGNIVDYCNKMGAKEVLTCEINDKFRAVLAEKSNVVGADFLELKAEDISHIDMIVMNPPFSTIRKHILHAWEIAPGGCEIVSLANSNILENGYYDDKDKQKINELVENYGGSEYLGRVFADSDERQTDVCVSVLRLYKPKTEEIEFEDYFTEEADDPEYSAYGIMPYNFVRDCVNRYVEAVRQFDSVMEVSNTINGLLDGIGAQSIHFGAKGRNSESITRDRFKKQVQKDAWRWIFRKFNIEKFITSKVMADINSFVELQQNIPFTMKNIYKMVEIIIMNRDNFFNQALCEAFDTICGFSSENSTAGEKWKTNSNYMVNKKFIVPWGCRITYGGRVSFGETGKMEDVTKALCNLMGTSYEKMECLYDLER